MLLSILDDAIKGWDYVIHTASPVLMTPPLNDNVLIKSEVEEKLTVMITAHKYKVNLFVITSKSVAGMFKLP